MAEHFDAVVIGNRLSGVIAAALLAKNKRRVLLLDHGENATHYSHLGYRMPLTPQLWPQFDSSSVLRRLHTNLGIAPEVRAETMAQNPSFQAVFSDHRVDIPAHREALRDELQKEFPALVQPIEGFLDGLHALNARTEELLDPELLAPAPTAWRHWRQRRRLRQLEHFAAPFETQKLLDAVPHDHPMREVLVGPLHFFTHLSSEWPSTFQAARLLDRFFRGTVTFAHDPLGGLHGFINAAAERAGVFCRRGAVVRGLESKGRKLTGVALEGDKHTYTADFFVDNSLSRLSELLPASKWQGRLAAEEQALRATGSLLVMNLLVDAEVIPKGMARSVFLLNGRRSPRADQPADPPIFVQRYPAQKRGPAPGHKAPRVDPSKAILSVACPVRTSEVARSPERFGALKAGIIARLKRLIPFLESFLEDASLPVDASAWEAEPGMSERRVDPWQVHPLYETNPDAPLGVGGRSPRTVLKNLLHCGPDIVPGLGLEGEYLTGELIAATLTRMAGRRWRKPSD